MTTLAEHTKKIFEALKGDSEYSTDADAMKEADKRAKQHERNNMALSLGSDLSKSSPALKSFFEFLQKAPKKGGFKWPTSGGRGKKKKTAKKAASPKASAGKRTSSTSQGEAPAYKIERVRKLSRKRLKDNPDKIYLFGDNLKGTGKDGQAVIRGLPNALGIPTKKSPGYKASDYFNDEEYGEAITEIDKALAKIPAGKTIVIPNAGLGTGRAQLQENAPEVFTYLAEKIGELEAGTFPVGGITPTPAAPTTPTGRTRGPGRRKEVVPSEKGPKVLPPVGPAVEAEILKNPLAATIEYLNILSDKINLGSTGKAPGIREESVLGGSHYYYYPHIERLLTVSPDLQKATGARRRRRIDKEFGVNNKKSLTTEFYKLKALENLEYDFSQARERGDDNERIIKFLRDIPYTKVISELTQEIFKDRLQRALEGDGAVFGNDDIAKLYEVVQDMRIAQAQDIKKTLGGTSLNDSWREKIPNVDELYGVEMEKYVHQRRLSRKKQAEGLLFGDKKLGVLGIFETTGGTIPEAGSEAHRIFIRASELYLPSAKRYITRAGGDGNVTTPHNYSMPENIRKRVEDLSDSAYSIFHTIRMGNPEQYTTDEEYQELLREVGLRAEKQAERTDAGRRKQILMANRPFGGPEINFDLEEDTSRKLTDVTEEDDELIAQTDVEGPEYTREVQDVLSAAVNEAEPTSTDDTRIEEEGDDIQTYAIPDDVKENYFQGQLQNLVSNLTDDAGKPLDLAFEDMTDGQKDVLVTEAMELAENELRQVYAPAADKSSVTYALNLPTTVPEGAYDGYVQEDFQNSLLKLSNDLFKLTAEVPVKRGKGKAKLETQQAVSDVYIAGDLAKAYLEIEDAPEIKLNTPIEFKVRSLTSQGQEAIDNFLDKKYKIANHPVSITSHVGQTSESNKDEYQVLFWNDNIFNDMGIMGKKGLAKKWQEDPFGSRDYGPAEGLSEETLGAELTTLLEEGRFRYASALYNPQQEEELFRLVESLPAFKTSYDDYHQAWKDSALDVEWEVDENGNNVLDEEGRKVPSRIITDLIADAHDKIATFHEPDGEAAQIWASNRIAKLDAYINRLVALESNLSLARTRTAEGRIFHVDSDEYKALEKAGKLPSEESGLAPSTVDSYGNPLRTGLVRLRGFDNVLKILSNARQEDMERLRTGFNPDGTDSVRPFNHEYEEVTDEDTGKTSRVSIGIPNLMKNIQLREADSDPNDETSWITVGHLLPTYNHWESINKGQLANEKDFDGTAWNVYHTDGSNQPSMGGWIHDEELAISTWSPKMMSGWVPAIAEAGTRGYTSQFGVNIQQHDARVARIPGDLIANMAGIEMLSHPPDATYDDILGWNGTGLNLPQLAQGLSPNQRRWRLALQRLDGKPLQKFRDKYKDLAKGFTRTKHGGGPDAYALLINGLFRDAEDFGTPSLERSIVPNSAPTAMDKIREKYSVGKSIAMEDRQSITEYLTAYGNLYRNTKRAITTENEKRSKNGQPLVLSSYQEELKPLLIERLEELGLFPPTQIVAGEEIPLISDKQFDYMRDNYITEIASVGQLFDATARDDLNNPLPTFLDSYRKYADMSEYMADMTDVEQDVPSHMIPSSMFRFKRDLSINYAKYKAIALSLGDEYEDSDTPVFDMLTEMNMLSYRKNGQPYIAEGLGLSVDRILSERLNRWSGGKQASPSARILAQNDKGETVIRSINLSDTRTATNKSNMRTPGVIRGRSTKLSNTSVLKALGWKELPVNATKEAVFDEIEKIRVGGTEEIDRLESMSPKNRRAELAKLGFSLSEIKNTFNAYESNLRSLDLSFVNIPSSAYRNRKWLSGGYSEKDNVSAVLSQIVQTNVFDNLITVNQVYMDTPNAPTQISGVVGQAEYEYRYLQELGRSIPDERKREAILDQAYNYINTLRDKAVESGVENPDAAANNSINVMLNNLGKNWFRFNPDYLTTQEYQDAVNKTPNWWDLPLAEMGQLQIRTRGQGMSVDVATKGLMKGVDAPVAMNLDNLLFNPSDLITPISLGNQIRIVPIDKDRSVLVSPQGVQVGHAIKDPATGGFDIFNKDGKKILPEQITAANLANGVDGTANREGEAVLSLDENTNIISERVALQTEDGESVDPKTAFKKYASPNLIAQAKDWDGWNLENIQLLLDDINKDRTKPLERLNAGHIDKYDIKNRLAAIAESISMGEIESSTPANIRTMDSKQKLTKAMMRFRTQVQEFSERAGIPAFATRLFAEEATEGVDHGQPLDGLIKLQDFMQEQGLLGENENFLVRFVESDAGTLGFVKGMDRNRAFGLVKAMVEGHGATSPEHEQAALEFMQNPEEEGGFGLEMGEDVLNRRQDSIEATRPVGTSVETPVEEGQIPLPLDEEGTPPGGDDLPPPTTGPEEMPEEEPEFDEDAPPAPPKLSRRAVEAAIAQGIPVSEEVQENVETRRLFEPEFYLALPDEETGKLKFNENLLGLKDAGHPELVNMFKNLLRDDLSHNYEYNPIEIKGDNKGSLVKPDTRSLFQGRWNSIFSQDDMRNFLNLIREGTDEEVNSFFKDTPDEREWTPDIGSMKSILSNYTPVELVEDVVPEEDVVPPVKETKRQTAKRIKAEQAAVAAAKTGAGAEVTPPTEYKDKYGRTYAIIDTQTQSLTDANGDSFGTNILTDFPLMDKEGVPNVDVVANLPDEDKELLRYIGLNPKQQQEELILRDTFKDKEGYYRDEENWGVPSDIYESGTPRYLAHQLVLQGKDKVQKKYDALAAQQESSSDGETRSREDIINKIKVLHPRSMGAEHVTEIPSLGNDYFEGRDTASLLAEEKELNKNIINKKTATMYSQLGKNANDMSKLQPPQSQHAEALEQYARSVILHQQLYGNMTKQDGKTPLMTDDTSAALDGILQNIEAGGTVNMLQLKESIANLGQTLIPDPENEGSQILPLVQEMRTKGEELTGLVTRDNQFIEYLGMHGAAASTGMDAGQSLIQRDSEGNPQEVILDAQGKISEVRTPAEAAESVKDSDLNPPHIIGLEPETRELWDKYHKSLVGSKDKRNFDMFKEQEIVLKEQGIAGLGALRAEIQQQIENLDIDAIKDARKESIRSWSNPLNIIGDYFKSGGITRKGYWNPEEVPVLNMEPIEEIISQYNVSPSALRMIMSKVIEASEAMLEVEITDPIKDFQDLGGYRFLDAFVDDFTGMVQNLTSDVRSDASKRAGLTRMARNLYPKLKEALYEEFSTKDEKGNVIGPDKAKMAEIDSWFTDILGQTASEQKQQEIALPKDAQGVDIEPPKIFNPNTKELEAAMYSPSLHAWVNPYVLEEKFGEEEEASGMYVANHLELNLNKYGSGIPTTQAFRPVDDNSPIANRKDIVRLPNGRWIAMGDINEGVKDKNSGPIPLETIASLHMGEAISNDKAANSKNYREGDQDYTITKFNIADDGTFQSSGPETLPPTVVEAVAPPKPEFFERGGAAAKFLAGLGGMSEDVKRQASFGQQLLARTKDFLNTPFGLKTMSLGFIIPMSESRRYTDFFERDLTMQARMQELTNKHLSNLSDAQTPKEEKLMVRNPETQKELGTMTFDNAKMAFNKVVEAEVAAGREVHANSPSVQNFLNFFGGDQPQVRSRVDIPGYNIPKSPSDYVPQQGLKGLRSWIGENISPAPDLPTPEVEVPPQEQV